MNGEWMKRSKWKVSHFVRADKRTLWMGEITGLAACGSCIKINYGLTPEPTGIDSNDRLRQVPPYAVSSRCRRCDRSRLRQLLNMETWNAPECAAHWGISEGRWRSLVSTGHAPPALPGYDPHTGRKRWDADTVRNYVRPGQGNRTDLHKTPDETE